MQRLNQRKKSHLLIWEVDSASVRVVPAYGVSIGRNYINNKNLVPFNRGAPY